VKRIEICSHRAHYERQIADLEKNLQTATEQSDKEKAKLEEALEGAFRYCPERIFPNQIKYKSEQYKSKILNMKRQIEAVQEQYL
jgi:septal ring factor EnvC (AmiA/AmiB activator)